MMMMQVQLLFGFCGLVDSRLYFESIGMHAGAVHCMN